jgi:hypothetical protein
MFDYQMSWILLEKLMIAQVFQKFGAFYRTQCYINLFPLRSNLFCVQPAYIFS